MKYEIITFATRRNNGEITENRITRDPYSKVFKLNNGPIIYKENGMLRHPLNYAIMVVVIDGRSYSVGDSYYYKLSNRDLKVETISAIEHNAEANIGGEMKITKFYIKFNDGDTKVIYIAPENNSNMTKHEEKLESEAILSYWGIEPKNPTKLKKPKSKKEDIKDEECLSINEIISILGGLEDCEKSLINYVKKKINK